MADRINIDWTEAVQRQAARLIADYYRAEIDRLMLQAEHHAARNYPLAVHHRVFKADMYFQVVALFERFGEGSNPFDTMQSALAHAPARQAALYPPSPELHRYRDPRFVVEKLATASRAAGGPNG